MTHRTAPQHPGLPRRHFFAAAGAAATAAAMPAQAQGGAAQGGAGQAGGQGRPASAGKPLPGYADWKDPEAVIVHTDLTVETRRDAFGTSGITPADELYVRNNLPPPSGATDDADAWELAVEGVARPRSLSLHELRRMEIETVAMVLQCSGNGRAFFAHDTSGTQWSVGAAGNVLWSGVPVRAVVAALGGVSQGRGYLTATGGEALPQGVDPKLVMAERSVPVAAMEHAILAWEMNGSPVPLAHGGPLRLVVPGYYGCNNIKYVRRLAFTEAESDAGMQRTSYRLRPVGVRGAPDQPSMWQMSVKSWVTHPLQRVEKGRSQIHGVAFGGHAALRGVEVSIDGGRTWKQARLLGPDMGRFAWRPFVLAADLAPGTHLIASRATDAQGTAQPEQFEPNERGYGHNGWRDHAVEVTVA